MTYQVKDERQHARRGAAMTAFVTALYCGAVAFAGVTPGKSLAQGEPAAVPDVPGPAGTAGAAGTPASTPSPGGPAPDSDDTADIFDDPDAGLRSDGLAPQERPPSLEAIDGTGFGAAERRLRDALMNGNCPGAQVNLDTMSAIANNAEAIATTPQQRDLVEEWRGKLAYYRPILAACGEAGFTVPWRVGEPTLTSPRTLTGDYMGIDGGDTDIVDRDLRRLGSYARSRNCETFWAEVARLRNLDLDYEQEYELDRLVREGCPPGVTSPPTQLAPDADDTADIFDDPDAGLRSDGLAPQERTPVTAPSAPPPAEPQSGPTVLLSDDQPAVGSVSPFLTIRHARIPQAGSGVRREGASGTAPETDTALSDGTVTTGGIGVVLEAGAFNLRAEYGRGDARTSFQADPISGGFNGQVFGGLSPSGRSGIGAGSASQTGATETEVSQFRIGGDLFVAQPTPRTRIFIAADYIRDERIYRSSITGTVGSSSSAITFTQERDQRITDNAFGLGVGGEWHLPLGPRPNARTVLLVRSVTQAFLLDSELRSAERNMSNFGPSSDRDFTLQFDENETAIGIAVSGSAELNHQVAPDVSIFVGGTVDYRSRVSGVFNPNSGDQVFFEGRTTELFGNDFWSYGGRIGLRISMR